MMMPTVQIAIKVASSLGFTAFFSIIKDGKLNVVTAIINDKIVPPVFLSANLDGGDEHNRKIFKEYKDNIFYM
mgnify:CR=1 FL=1